MYIKCPACDEEVLIDNVSQAMGISLNGCEFHSETKNFNGNVFFKKQDYEINVPRVRLTGGQWISMAEYDEMVKERKRKFYQEKRDAEKKRKFKTRKDWD